MGGKYSKDGGAEFESSSDMYLLSRPISEVLLSRPNSEVLLMKTTPSLIAKPVQGLVAKSAESDSMSQGVPSIEDIKDFLECQVCTCFVATPIYSCPNGHVICGICKPKIFKCPSCDAENLAVNGLVERILKNKGVETPCRNNYVGCTRRIKVWEMKEHLDDICDFRLIKCTERVPKQCGDTYYAPKDLLQHWITFHGALATKVEVFVSTEPAVPTESSVVSNLLCAVKTRYCLNKNDYIDLITNADSTIKWRVSYFELDGQTFLIHARTFGESFHVWITFLGEESEAKKYQYTCTISSDLCTLQPEREVTFYGIHVHSLQYCDFEKVRELGHTTAIRVQNLKMLQDTEPLGPDDMLNWNAEIDLSQVGSQTLDSSETLL